ncbi:MAG TPA: 3-oxoacyl-[acyl-carrier-protein] synthase III C-terminal domain-containing protein [Candidatus Limnocylindria bacterium]|nr:3-oxoacyl-[acyl-carrier-protein] synthase III C-terminal domain-containing protein [Candidatus Limnocylindria bacterium]
MHPAPAGDRGSGGAPDLHGLRRRVRRHPGQRRTRGAADPGLRGRRHPGQRRPDHLARRRAGLRHAPVRRRPGTIARGLPAAMDGLRNRLGIDDISLWAVHPGGRSVLDAVEQSLGLPPEALAASREVLRRYGNMSSPTVMFVLKALMRDAPVSRAGVAIAFGPGLTAETMVFHGAGRRV